MEEFFNKFLKWFSNNYGWSISFLIQAFKHIKKTFMADKCIFN